MSIGIFVFQTNTSMDSAVLAKHAEDLGFESFWVVAHTGETGLGLSGDRLMAWIGRRWLRGCYEPLDG